MNDTRQSGGMPLAAPGDRGAECDAMPSAYYCRHCYRSGAFTEPEPRSR
jgi:hypothetical protein